MNYTFLMQYKNGSSLIIYFYFMDIFVRYSLILLFSSIYFF